MQADQVKERPILFSAPMIRALLDGKKTQTRREIVSRKKAAPYFVLYERREHSGFWPVYSADGERGHYLDDQGHDIEEQIACPYGQPGERLWVREAFIHEPADYCWEASVSIPCRPSHTVYRADVEGDSKGAGWKPSIHMPRNLSRILLEITEVRVERLRSITEADALAEGIVRLPDGGFGLPKGEHYHAADPRISYLSLWESINGPGSVEAEPWLWAVSFRRLKP